VLKTTLILNLKENKKNIKEINKSLQTKKSVFLFSIKEQLATGLVRAEVASVLVKKIKKVTHWLRPTN